jgi:hypothetical protein
MKLKGLSVFSITIPIEYCEARSNLFRAANLQDRSPGYAAFPKTGSTPFSCAAKTRLNTPTHANRRRIRGL